MNYDDQDPTTIVAQGYDQITAAYFENYRRAIPGVVVENVELFESKFADGSSILELGCGNGLPFTAQMAERHDVTGIDISKNQIELARSNVPAAIFKVADMSTVSFPNDTFNGILALYSIIHVPRDRHATLFESIYNWLKPGGVFEATLGWSDSEAWVDENWLGAKMYWSHYAPEKSRELIDKSGLVVESERFEELINPGDGETERHYWVTARKPE